MPSLRSWVESLGRPALRRAAGVFFLTGFDFEVGRTVGWTGYGGIDLGACGAPTGDSRALVRPGSVSVKLAHPLERSGELHLVADEVSNLS